MTHYAIFDRNVGLLQYDVEADSPLAALQAFDATVGIDPHGSGLTEVAKEFDIIPVTPHRMRKINAWVQAGSRAGEDPFED